jgi:hypothetical protein
MSDAVGKRLRFARTGARDDQKRGTRSAGADAVFNRCPLALVQVHHLTSCRTGVIEHDANV